MKQKYPRTYHFDFSLGVSDDDKIQHDLSFLEIEEVVVTEKMDGENSSLYNNHYHPRSLTDDGHESRSWLKGFASTFQYMIPEGWRICGENLYAAHSIEYENLKSYFYGFSMYNKHNYCLDWLTTLDIFDELGITPAPVLYQGTFDYDVIKQIFLNQNHEKSEGIVCRKAGYFHYDDFRFNVIKAVRSNHVRSDVHWSKNWKKNKLK